MPGIPVQSDQACGPGTRVQTDFPVDSDAVIPVRALGSLNCAKQKTRVTSVALTGQAGFHTLGTGDASVNATGWYVLVTLLFP